MDGGGWQHNHDQYEQLTIWLDPTSIKKQKKKISFKWISLQVACQLCATCARNVIKWLKHPWRQYHNTSILICEGLWRLRGCSALRGGGRLDFPLSYFQPWYLSWNTDKYKSMKINCSLNHRAATGSAATATRRGKSSSFWGSLGGRLNSIIFTGRSVDNIQLLIRPCHMFFTPSNVHILPSNVCALDESVYPGSCPPKKLF